MSRITTSYGDVVSYKDDEATKQAVFDRVMEYFKKHESFNGESIMQSDDPQIYAPEVMADIADNILCFKYVDESEEPTPPARERATPLEYLEWFRLYADFGPGESDYIDSLNQQFMDQTGKNLPEGWNYARDGETVIDRP